MLAARCDTASCREPASCGLFCYVPAFGIAMDRERCLMLAFNARFCRDCAERVRANAVLDVHMRNIIRNRMQEAGAPALDFKRAELEIVSADHPILIDLVSLRMGIPASAAVN
jgi:hypothetical protein